MQLLLIILMSTFMSTTPLNQENTQVYVPLSNTTTYGIGHSYHSTANYNVSTGNFSNVNSGGMKMYSSAYTALNRKSVSYGGGSYSVAAGGPGGNNGGGKDNPGGQGGGGYNPGGGGGSSTKTCPMCNGSGYINDYGNGEVVTATWWRNVGAGDGTYCDGVATYHDSCDNITYGQTYHHDGKRVCPCCGGTGKVSSSVSSRWMSQNGWVQWTGESWSHLYHDEDGDGHCDEHYWHLPAPVGDIPYYIVIPIIFIYCLKKRRKLKEVR